MRNSLLLLGFFLLGSGFSIAQREFWIDYSNPIPKMSVLDIENVYSFDLRRGSARVVVGGAGGATDYGPYKSTYLIFDNGYELPWRYATYELGRFGSIKKVSKKSGTEILLEVNLYSKIDYWEGNYYIIIDLSDVIARESKMNGNMTEGSIDSKVKVVIEEITE